MKLRICRYSLYTGQNGHLMKRLISLLLLLYRTSFVDSTATTKPTPEKLKIRREKEEVEIDTIPFYNGTYVGVDLYGIGKLLGGDFMSSEISIAVNLKNKFIPTVEFGMGGTDAWSETGIHYKSKWPLSSASVWITTQWQREKKRIAICMPVSRYAFSSFKYDVSTLPADDPIWGDNINNPSLEDDYWGGSIVQSSA